MTPTTEDETSHLVQQEGVSSTDHEAGRGGYGATEATEPNRCQHHCRNASGCSSNISHSSAYLPIENSQVTAAEIELSWESPDEAEEKGRSNVYSPSFHTPQQSDTENTHSVSFSTAHSHGSQFSAGFATVAK